MKEEAIKKAVKENYSRIVRQGSSCCSPVSTCSGSGLQESISKKIGYTEEDLGAVPEGANLGLGCGNPVALASLKEGETVIDLGSGAGFDCFLAAGRVGEKGKIIGVDMTPDMVDRARENARKGNYENVEFRLGEIENLPVADSSADVVISNCVINLAPDKDRVFKEAYRVLKPGGRVMISDIVLLRELPDFITNSIGAYVACVSGAITREKYIEAVKEAGFREVEIVDEAVFPVEGLINDPAAQAIINDLRIPAGEIKGIASSIVSAKVYGVKPGQV